MDPPPCIAEARKQVPQSSDNYDPMISTSSMPNTLASAIAAKPATVPFQSKQARFAILPRERHADVRLSSYRSDEDAGGHGPGSYTAFTSLGEGGPPSKQCLSQFFYTSPSLSCRKRHSQVLPHVQRSPPLYGTQAEHGLWSLSSSSKSTLRSP